MKIARRTPFGWTAPVHCPLRLLRGAGESPFCTVFRYSESGPSIYMFSACRMGFRTAETEYLRENLLSAFIL